MMATALLRRLPRLASSAVPRRALSTTPTRRATRANEVAGTGKYGSSYVMDTHTVEDLQGMSAQDVLAEHAGRPEKQMRHFTGASCPPAVLRTES
jgi:NADH dehydrogenase (ubiquinone) Fe-S protein 2